MAYPYDSYGDLSEAAYDELFSLNERILDEWDGVIDWTEAREAFFEAAQELYPDIEDRDLWDTWRDYYETAAG